MGARRRSTRLLVSAAVTGTFVAAAIVAGTADAEVRSTGPAAPGAASARYPGDAHITTLPTGDTVTETGGATAVKAGPGRSGITFLTRRVDGRLRVVPSDAVPQSSTAGAGTATGHELTLVHLGRDGAPATTFETVAFNLDTSDVYEVPTGAAARTVRVPAGRYAILSKIVGNGDTTMLVQPALDVSGSRTVTVDARLGRPVTVTVPNPSARPILAYAETLVLSNASGIAWGLVSTSFDRQYIAQLGGGAAADHVVTQIGGVWARTTDGDSFDSPYAYRLNWYERGRLPTGFTRRVAASNLATVRSVYHSAVPGVPGWASPGPQPIGFSTSGSWTEPVGFRLPAVRTEFVNVERDMYWLDEFSDGETWFTGASRQIVESRYTAGRTYEKAWNRAVFGPSFPAYGPRPSVRAGDTVSTWAALYADASDRWGISTSRPARTVLYRDGRQIGEQPDVAADFAVPPEPATYRLVVEAGREAPHELAVRTTVAWTFRSGHVDGVRVLPLSVVRFEPRTDPYNAAPAGRRFEVPVTMDRQPGSAAGPVTGLEVSVSYDDGATWQRVPVRSGGGRTTALLDHPAGAAHVSLRATATDTAGNTVEQTIIRAYRLSSR